MSKLQEQTRRRLATRSYDADFEIYQARPVYIVQVFTFRAACGLAGPDDQGRTELRFIRHWRSAQGRAFRRRLAARLRQMRKDGLTPADVQSLALRMIHAPESYGGEIRSKTAQEITEELATRF